MPERVRFLCISCAILDEFFEIRVASLKELQEAGAVQPGADGLSVPEQLKAIRLHAVRLVDEQYEALNDVLIPELAKNGVIFVEPETWTPAVQAAWLKDYFTREVKPVLSPLALDPARPFPKTLNKSQNFAVVVEGEDGFGRQQRPRLWSRRCGPSRASFDCPTNSAAATSSSRHHQVEAFVSTLFAGGMECAAAISSVSRARRTCSWNRKKSTICCAPWRASSASRRYGDAGAAGDCARLPG